MIDVGGTLYGTTIYGGAFQQGTVFSITTSGVEKVLHSFGSGNDGAFPVASLINVGGRLYGTTESGGLGHGTVFSVTTSGVEKLLHSFAGGSDGAFPLAGLVNVGGSLYGTTKVGGGNGCCGGSGTVFKVTTSGTESVVYSFKGMPDGAFPAAGLIDVGGTLYGTTATGGTYCSNYGCGTVFSITTGGSENVLHSFGNGTDGKTPTAGLISVGGTLYGTTEGGGSYACKIAFFGCGTVFSITTGGSEEVRHSFGNGTDGKFPTAGLINVGGTLYGTTSQGGRHRAFGVVFSVSQSGAEKVLHSFSTSGGGATTPNGLIDVDGTLYGTASLRGQFGGGAVFVQAP